MDSYRKVIQKINSLEIFGIQLGLDRIRKLLDADSNPHNKLRIIHIAGTNGKGSTAAFISNILEYAGYKVGLYTSPHLVDLRERIKINGQYIKKKDLVRLTNHFLNLAQQLKLELTYFELLTVVAFKYFYEQQTDFMVLETGLGGRLDATNIIKRPLVSVITNIDYEHTQYLGTRLEQIAYEKAGIIKKQSLVVTSAKQRRVLSVFRKVCKKRKSELFQWKKHFYTVLQKTRISGAQVLSYSGIFNNLSDLEINILGKHQIENAGLAVATIELLKYHNIYISESAIREGLLTAVWPGRMEYKEVFVKGKKIRFLLDGAHNPAGMRILKNSLLQTGLKYKKLILLIGILADKDIKKMVNEIVGLVSKVIVTKTQCSRAEDSKVLLTEFRRYIPSEKIKVTNSIFEGLKVSIEEFNNQDLILVTGSLYTVGESLAKICCWEIKN